MRRVTTRTKTTPETLEEVTPLIKATYKQLLDIQCKLDKVPTLRKDSMSETLDDILDDIEDFATAVSTRLTQLNSKD